MQFRTRPEGFKAIRNRVIVMMTVITILILGIIAGPGLFSDNPTSRESSLMTIPILMLVMLFSVVISLKRERKQFLTFALTIDGDTVVRERLGLPTITIHERDIVSIVRGSNRSLLITGANKTDKISVPPQMENYDEMIALLTKLRPITEDRRSNYGLSLLIALAMIGVLAVDFLVKDRLINIISYSLTVIAMTASLVLIQRSPLMDRRIKRMSWVGLIALLSFLMILISLIRGE